MKKLSVLLLTLALAAGCLAQDVAYQKFKLSNGLTVILHEDHSLPIVAVNLWYHVGSKDEMPRRSGFAHLFEHLMFMGTERVPVGQFDTIMETGGGSNNASTSNDRTNYFEVGPSHLLPTLLWLEADRLEDLGRLMDQKKLDLQREVVRNERRESENSPYGKADMKLSELMFPPGHPYHIDVIGTHEDLEAAQVKDVKDFFSTYYVPANASLVVAGDFDPKTAKPLIEKLFGSLPRGDDPVHRDAAPVKLHRVVRHVMTDQVQAPRITMAWHSPPYYAPGDAELDLAAAVLSSGISSRLYQRLVYQEALVTDVSAGQRSLVLGSNFVVEAILKPEVELGKVEKAIDEVLAEFVRKGPTKAELQRQVAGLEFSSLSSLQSIQGKADRLNEYEFHFGEPNSFKRVLDTYKSATPDSVRKAAAAVLKPNERVILTVLPQAPKPEKNPRDERPASAVAGAWSPPLPSEFRLKNGIEVRYWHRPELPLMAMTAYIEHGSAKVTADKAGLLALTTDMLDEGAGDLNATEFEQALDMLGARFGASASQEAVTISVTSTATSFPKALDLFADAVMRPKLDQKEWDRVKRLHLEGLQLALDDPGTVARRTSMREFFGAAHPYGVPLSGTAKSVDLLSLADVKSELTKIQKPSVIFAAGSMPQAEMQALLEREIGSWPVTAVDGPVVPITGAKPEKLRLVIVEKPGAVQTVIRFMMPAPSAHDPKRVELQAIGTVLGGTFTSRLNSNLREDKGYTYGAGSRFVLEPQIGYLTASANVRADVTGESLKEFMKELDSIRTGNITNDESAKAAASMRTDVVQSASSLQGLLSAAIGLHALGLPFQALGAEMARIAALNPTELNALARTSIPKNGLLVLVGDKALILSEIAGLGLPEPEFMQAE